MADLVKGIFENKKAVAEKLIDFGFVRNESAFRYTAALPESGFVLTVTVQDNNITAVLVDPVFKGQYTMHLTDVGGRFVGSVRAEFEAVLRTVAAKCFETDIYRSHTSLKLIDYVRTKYGDELEFLWEKPSLSAVLRRKDTGKWYGVLLKVNATKLGIERDEIVEILDFRIEPEILDEIVDNARYFRGYHMHKRSWCTVILDGVMPFDEICQHIDNSYLRAVK